MTADLERWSSSTARTLLSPLRSRLRHVESVVERVATAASTLPASQRDVLCAAAWLHDIGYAPELVNTGLHPLDGARFLQRQGCKPLLFALVAHHSAARIEAEERGLLDELLTIPEPKGPLLDVLTWADMTTGPDGESLTLLERIAEILHRYPEADPVHRAIVRARPELAATVERTQRQIDAAMA